jgi:hypothetical protein
MAAKKENSANDCNNENAKISVTVKTIAFLLDRMSESVQRRTQFRK